MNRKLLSHPLKDKIAEASLRKFNPAALNELLVQNENIYASSAVENSLNEIKKSGCVAVITGQQIGLFLGPLYTLYKALSAVCMARSIKKTLISPPSLFFGFKLKIMTLPKYKVHKFQREKVMCIRFH